MEAQNKRIINSVTMVRVRGIEPRSRVWKTRILTAVLHPLVGTYGQASFCRYPRQKLRPLPMFLLSKTKPLVLFFGELQGIIADSGCVTDRADDLLDRGAYTRSTPKDLTKEGLCR